MPQIVKSFLLYTDQSVPLEKLSNEQKGKLLQAMFDWQLGKPVTFDDPIVDVVFSFFEQTFKRDEEKYAAKCEKARESVRKRWNTKVNEPVQTDTNVYERIQDDTNHTNSNSTSNSNSDKKKNISKEKPDQYEPKTTRFTPPTVEEVRAFCDSRQNGIDAERFVSFYASKGWMIGKNKMKDWKQAIYTWEKQRKEEAASAEPAWKLPDWVR